MELSTTSALMQKEQVSLSVLLIADEGSWMLVTPKVVQRPFAMRTSCTLPFAEVDRHAGRRDQIFNCSKLVPDKDGKGGIYNS